MSASVHGQPPPSQQQQRHDGSGPKRFPLSDNVILLSDESSDDDSAKPISHGSDRPAGEAARRQGPLDPSHHESETMGKNRMNILNKTAVHPVNTLFQKGKKTSHTLSSGIKSFAAQGSSPVAPLRLERKRSLSTQPEIHDLTGTSKTGATITPEPADCDDTEEWVLRLGPDRRESKTHGWRSGSSVTKSPSKVKGSDTKQALLTKARNRQEESPDILLSCGDPQPACVESDLPQGSPSRRGILANSEQKQKVGSSKRCGVPDGKKRFESEDELGAEPKQLGKRETNFAHVSNPRQPRTRSREIYSSEFAPGLPSQSLHVIKAVCGSNMYTREGNPLVKLEKRSGSGKSRLVPVNQAGKQIDNLEWMCVDLSSIKSLERSEPAGTHGAFVVIHRPQTYNAKSTLCLEFGRSSDLSVLQGIIGDSSKLKSIVETAFKEAKSWQLSHKKHVSTKDDSKPTPRPSNTSAEVINGTMNQDAPKRHEGLISKMRNAAQTMAVQEEAVKAMKPPPVTDKVSPTMSASSKYFPSPSRVSTRRTRQSSPPPAKRQRTPESWTAKNPDWQKAWKSSLVFPATGKNRATVDADDIIRLDEGQLLNDNLLAFYLRYLEHMLEVQNSQAQSKVYIFNTFFYEKLRSTKSKINYEGVKTWTAKIDLFSYDYVIVPVNESAHWYLAIICNVQNTLKKCIKNDDESCGARTVDAMPPKIITLDSLGQQRSAACRCLREYLIEEARHKRGVDLVTIPNGMTAKSLPEQGNGSDCGVYLLAYTEQFLNNPEECCRKLYQKEDLGWKVDSCQLRHDIRTLILRLQQQQQEARAKQMDKRIKSRLVSKGMSSKKEGPETSSQSLEGLPRTAKISCQDAPPECVGPREDAKKTRQTLKVADVVKVPKTVDIHDVVESPQAVKAHNVAKPPETATSHGFVNSPEVVEAHNAVKSPHNAESSKTVESVDSIKILKASSGDEIKASNLSSSKGTSTATNGVESKFFQSSGAASGALLNRQTKSVAQATSVLHNGDDDVKFISCIKSSASPSTESSNSIYHSAQSSPTRQLRLDKADTMPKSAGVKKKKKKKPFSALPVVTVEDFNSSRLVTVPSSSESDCEIIRNEAAKASLRNRHLEQQGREGKRRRKSIDIPDAKRHCARYEGVSKAKNGGVM
ncbi:hypothetical protein CDD82_2632 [Ophiocordyceps australis]|uniref:Ubiquitin-like protease family profile domain-containing protein n=1 Tax=Ophiocordyceps australis TaxID=1399860 RepID=A0A2C5ZV89_9HYPO|nr:hypothetical protein CDD82_2632 [Ophiocordyceps australis]